MGKFFSLIVGAAEIAGAAALFLYVPGGAAAAKILLTMGIGTIVAGVGTLLTHTPNPGIVTTQRNPTAPWEYCYGRVRTGGVLVYENTWPPPGNGSNGNDQVVDVVIVVAAHSCQSIDAVLFDGQRVQIDTTAAAPEGPIGGYPAAGSGTSFTPVQRTIYYNHLYNGVPDGPTQIQRVNGVVKVTLSNNIAYLIPGDPIELSNVPGDLTLNGRWQVAEIISQVASPSPGSITFTFLSGGPNSNVTNAGWVTTLWADYGRTVYFEPLYGQQTLGTTFGGMVFGTPYLGSTGTPGDYVSPGAIGGAMQGENTPNPWVDNCSLQGKTALFLRLTFASSSYKGSLPLFSFLMHGKNNILDPRIGTNGTFTVTAATVFTALGVTSITYTIGFQLTVGNLVTVAGATATGFNVVQQVVVAVTGTTATVYAPNPGASFSGTATLTVYVYTENSALCIADYLSIPLEFGGYGAKYGTEIPYAQLIAAANLCDVAVPLAGTVSPPATEPAYACNGKFDLDESRGAILNNMLTSCGGRITYTGGQFEIWPAAWLGNSFAIGSNPGGGVVSLPAFSQIAAGPIRWRPTVQIRDLFNGVKGTYVSPANKWILSDFPPYAQDSEHGYTGPSQYDGDQNLANDGGDRRWKDIALRFTISASAAQRIAKIELLRCRLFGSGTLTFNMTAYQIVAMDLILVTIPFLGWSAKQLEVQTDRLRIEAGPDGSAPSMFVDLDVKEADPNQYNWSTTEELTAQGYQQPTQAWNFNPVETVPGFTAPYPWKPASVAPLKGDAYFPTPVVSGTNEGPASFGMAVVYGTDASGNATANLAISGVYPPNALSAIDPPQISCVVGTSGNLPAGSYFVAASAIDTGTPARNSIFGTPIRVTIPLASPPVFTGSIAVTVAWPSGSNGGEIYLASTNPADGFCFQTSLTASTTTYTITAFNQSTPGAPDATADHVATAFAPVEHGGVWAQQVQAVTSTTVTIAGAGMTLNQWAGYVLTLYGKLDPTQALIVLNMPVASNTASSGGTFVLTIGPNANGDQLPNLTTLLEVGDLVVMRGNYTFTASSFSDPNVANPYYPSGATNVEAGHVAIVMTGVDAGDIQTIDSVALDGTGHSTIFELAGTFVITPNPGDLVIIASAWGPETPGQSFSSPSRAAASGVAVAPSVTNLANQPWIFIVRMETSDYVSGDDAYAPMRDLYFFGFQGTRTVGSSTTMLNTDKIVVFANISANAIYTCLPFASVLSQTFLIERFNCGPYTVTISTVSGDTFPGGGTSIVLTDDTVNYFTEFTVPASQ